MSDRPLLYELNEVRKEFLVGAVKVPALRGVTLSIPTARFIALQGPSGSGKSTLLNVLGLLEVPSSGSLRFCGTDVIGCTETSRTNLRRHSIGFIFQNFNLVPVLTALENVEYPLMLDGKMGKAERDRAKTMLYSVGLAEFMEHRPAQLSGGQRQRVAIARALVKNPKLILADEPTANLDSENAKEVMQIMQTLQHNLGTTVIVATHDNDIAALADDILHLKDGHMVTVPGSAERIADAEQIAETASRSRNDDH